MMTFNEDGVDHIRIHINAKTSLGRKLSDFYVRPFRTETNAEFNHLIGLSMYLKTGKRHSWLRHEDPITCVTRGSKYRAVWNESFRDEYKEGVLASLEQDPALIEELKGSTLPLLVYRTKPWSKLESLHSILSEIYTEIRESLQEDPS